MLSIEIHLYSHSSYIWNWKKWRSFWSVIQIFQVSTNVRRMSIAPMQQKQRFGGRSVIAHLNSVIRSITSVWNMMRKTRPSWQTPKLLIQLTLNQRFDARNVIIQLSWTPLLQFAISIAKQKKKREKERNHHTKCKSPNTVHFPSEKSFGRKWEAMLCGPLK